MIIKRSLLDDLIKHLENKEISLVVGPRQSGKTTLMNEVRNYLESLRKKTLYFNLDLESDWRFFISQKSLIDEINLDVGKSEAYIFIDEIQRKENAGLFLKGLYDLNLPYKFIVSGSGSLELKEKIHESLAGRKRVFELPTVTFAEFLEYKTGYKYEGRLNSFIETHQSEADGFLREYLVFGGYPKVITTETVEEKAKIIDEIYQSYLVRDISYIFNIEKTEAFTHLVRLLASVSGRIVNYNYLGRTLEINNATVRKFLWYLEKTFIASKVTPYFKNLGKELRKAPVYYFLDLGLRSYSEGRFSIESLSLDRQRGGFLFQNFVFRILTDTLKESFIDLHFWRTKDGAEVDFIVERGVGVTPLEVKYENPKEAKISGSLRSYINKYKPERAIVVNLSLEEDVKVDRTEVHFVPYYFLLKRDFLYSLLWNV